MARVAQLPVPTEDLESTSSEAEAAAAQPRLRRGLLALAAAGAVGALAFVALGGRGAAAAPAPERLTVRALLEGDAVAEAATDNLVAMGGITRADGSAMERAELKGKVSESFKNISAFIRSRDPESHRRLDEIEVTDAQKAAAIARLGHYSNPALVKLANEVTALYQKHHAMHQEIADKVLSQSGALKTVAEALFPVQRDGSFSMPVSSHGWKGEVQVDFGRRLSGVESLGGVAPQARTLLEGLETDLGDRMPKAPSRVLFELTSDVSGSPSTGSTDSTGFMNCLQKAVPNPVEVCSCIASNMSNVVSMMMEFMKSHAPGFGGSSSSATSSATSR